MNFIVEAPPEEHEASLLVSELRLELVHRQFVVFCLMDNPAALKCQYRGLFYDVSS